MNQLRLHCQGTESWFLSWIRALFPCHVMLATPCSLISILVCCALSMNTPKTCSILSTQDAPKKRKAWGDGGERGSVRDFGEPAQTVHSPHSQHQKVWPSDWSCGSVTAANQVQLWCAEEHHHILQWSNETYTRESMDLHDSLAQVLHRYVQHGVWTILAHCVSGKGTITHPKVTVLVNPDGLTVVPKQNLKHSVKNKLLLNMKREIYVRNSIFLSWLGQVEDKAKGSLVVHFSKSLNGHHWLGWCDLRKYPFSPERDQWKSKKWL